MRDIVPSRERRSSVRTPWTTYTDVTPKVSTRRRAMSTSTRRGREGRPRSVSSSEELPHHESTQLPRKHSVRKISRKPKPSPIDILEEFIRHLTSEDREAVRATYNGPDWPHVKATLRQRSKNAQPRAFVPKEHVIHHPVQYVPTSMTCLDLSRQPQNFILPPPVGLPQNRFLTYLNAQNAFAPGVHFFPHRGT